jgi:Protein tyrosine/serine phosphatase
MGSLLESTLNTRLLPAGGGRFVRSDCPLHLTDGEVAFLRETGVTTVVDLRSPEECAAAPCRLEGEEGFFYHHLPVTGGERIPKNAEELTAIYLGMLDGRMDEIVDTILNAPGRALFFCGSGKDRTGVVSAVLLRRLGCDDAAIIGDYLETKANLTELINAYLEKHPEVDPALLIPDVENIKKVLAALE